MISERLRNIIVGLTFLAALILLMYGIVLMGKFPFIGGGIHRYPVILMADNANGVGSGNSVNINGVPAGQVESSWVGDDGQGKLVAYIRLNIESNFNIPESASASLVRPATVGTPYVDIKAETSKAPFIKKDGSAILRATAPESSLLPKAVTDDIHLLKGDLATLSHQLGTVAQDLHTLLVYTPPEDVEKANPEDPDRPRVNASTVIIRLDRTVASLQQLLGDPKLQGQVRTIVQNLADASEQLKTTLDKINTTVANANSAVASVTTSVNTAATSIGNAASSIGSAATQATTTIQSIQKNIDRVSQQLIETLNQLEKSSRDITEGKGTTGRLVQDPRLYENLIDLSKSLKSTVQDLDFLVNKWKDEGLNLK